MQHKSHMDKPAELVTTQGGESQQKKIIRFSLKALETLHKAENAWKRPSGKPTGDTGVSLEEAKTQDVLRELRAILNKLTPDNFSRLMKTLLQLEINTEARLKAVIGIIFDKAVSEQQYCPVYAKMCHHLLGLNVESGDGHCVTFHKVLLRHCQNKFEKNSDEEEILNIQKELEATENEANCQQLQLKLEEVHYRSRRSSLGNMKLIGELFKLKIVTEKTVHRCLVKLLKDEHEESLECLSKLITTIGKDLDTQNAKPNMDYYFAYINKIIQRGNKSVRIRFMLLDLMDLRKNNWIPRRDEDGPKVIREIRRDQFDKSEGALDHENRRHRSKEQTVEVGQSKEPPRCEDQHVRRDCERNHVSLDLGSVDLSQNWGDMIIIKGSSPESPACDKLCLRTDCEKDQLGQSSDSTTSPQWCIKSEGSGEESPSNNWRIKKVCEKDELTQPDQLYKYPKWCIKSNDYDKDSYSSTNWRIKRDPEQDHLGRSVFSETFNWRLRSRGSDKDSYSSTNWRMNRDHEQWERPDDRYRSLNWRMRSCEQKASRDTNWRIKRDH